MLQQIVAVIITALLATPAALAADTLTMNGDGTVTDSSTLLTWQQGDTNAMTWEAALTYCSQLSLASRTDWRLPNIKELYSLANFAHDLTFFPGAQLRYWSSTTVNNPSYLSNAMVLILYPPSTLSATAAISKTDSANARCVSGG